MKIVIEDPHDRRRLREKYCTVRQPYISKSLSFRLHTEVAMNIRRDALGLPSAKLIGASR